MSINSKYFSWCPEKKLLLTTKRPYTNSYARSSLNIKTRSHFTVKGKMFIFDRLELDSPFKGY